MPARVFATPELEASWEAEALTVPLRRAQRRYWRIIEPLTADEANDLLSAEYRRRARGTPFEKSVESLIACLFRHPAVERPFSALALLLAIEDVSGGPLSFADHPVPISARER